MSSVMYFPNSEPAYASFFLDTAAVQTSIHINATHNQRIGLLLNHYPILYDQFIEMVFLCLPYAFTDDAQTMDAVIRGQVDMIINLNAVEERLAFAVDSIEALRSDLTLLLQVLINIQMQAVVYTGKHLITDIVGRDVHEARRISANVYKVVYV